jgi:hypothetical protein
MIRDYNSRHVCVAVGVKFGAYEVLSLSFSIPKCDPGSSLSCSGLPR